MIIKKSAYALFFFAFIFFNMFNFETNFIK